MPPLRVGARRTANRQIVKERNAKRNGKEWIVKQVSSENAWTRFSYPLDRLKFCYSLADLMFEIVCFE